MITPSGDPISMLALAVPMTVFYLVSILIGLIFQKRKRARGDSDDEDDQTLATSSAPDGRATVRPIRPATGRLCRCAPTGPS